MLRPFMYVVASWLILQSVTDFRVSVREAARIQSFPDDYYFEGSRSAVFTQIGNAVPPILSNIIAEGIKKRLTKVNPSSYQIR